VRQRGYKVINNVKIMDNRKENMFMNKRVEKPKNECIKTANTVK
jgi:DNA-binding winged helix-turn-helix (wHTH) protein